MQADEIRTQQRQTWDRFSAGWVKWDELVMAMLAPVRDAIVTGVAPAPDAEHLDIASGTGEPGLTIAAMAPDGHVVLSDLSIGMLDSAREAAAARGLANVEFREADASALPFDDASFDSVSCRFGFMFFPDLVAAAREVARVLRPGGVVSTSVWAGPESNEWAVVPMMVIAGVVATIEPPDRYWDYMSEVAAPVAAGLAMADDAGKARIREETIAAMQRFVVDGRMDAPGLARVTTARKA